jgi:hypothetical protein
VLLLWQWCDARPDELLSEVVSVLLLLLLLTLLLLQ